MNIHKEGKKIIPVSFVILGLLYALLFWLIPIQVIQVFLTIAGIIFENEIIAPADGKVVVIEETDETEYLKDRRIQVSIFMSPLNVHVNRSPIDGLISYFKYHPGKFLVAWHPKSSTDNERTTIGIKMKNGIEVIMAKARFKAKNLALFALEVG
jgi:phosphatidylserine decarboxylase